MPEIRASLPTITVRFDLLEFFFNQEPYAAANITASTGVKFDVTSPPMVPLIPDIDFIKVINLNFKNKDNFISCNNKKKLHQNLIQLL